MEYELYLRAPAPEAAGARRLVAAMRGDPDLEGAGSRFRIDLPDGVLTLMLHPDDEAYWDHPDDAERFGVDLQIPGGANPRLAAAACERAFAWASDHGLTVYDPQLGREVKSRDEEAIVTRISRLADYLTDTVGLDGDAGAAQIVVDPTRPAMPFRTKFYLALAGALVLLALLTRFC